MGRRWRSRIFHEPGCEDGRQRSLFPLPTLKGVGDIAGQVCSSVRQRLHRREHIRERVNMAIDAMNSLYFGRSGPCGGEVANISSLPQGQRECIRSIVESVSAFGAPPPAASRSRALQALRASSGGYCEPEVGVGDVVDMQLSQLSLPRGSVAGVNLDESLEGPLEMMVNDFGHWMLQDASTWSSICDDAYKIKPYNDPSLAHRPTYLAFLKHLNSCGILGTTSVCRGRVGAFSVSKKPKLVGDTLCPRQRLILDCRQVNLQFREPPHCELGSLAAVSEMVLEKDQTLFVSGSDIQDCFYAARISSEFSNFFCLLSDITSSEAHSIFGDEFTYNEFGRISPCITVLPMGFSWSFYLIQKMHEQSALRALQCDRSQLILDGYPSPKLSGSQVAAMPYCDNVHCMSLDQESCQRGKDRMCEDLTGLGFTLHEDAEASSFFPTLGGIIDGKNGKVKPTPSRAWNVILAFESLLEGPVDWVVLQRLLGHAMTICTINRYGMSIFRSLYDYVEAAPIPRPLNKKERQEVRTFIGLVPLLVGEMKRPWSTTISCSDSSPEGYGVCQRHLEKDRVHELGSWQDRWRFKHLEPSLWRPRERAQGLDVVGDPRTARASKSEGDIKDMYSYNNYFPEVPLDVTEPSAWQTKLMGRWSNTGEHITVKEGRALVLAVKRLTRSSSSRGQRHLVLLDSFALCMAVNKGRACNFKMLRCMQQLSALCLAGGFSVRVRWVPSERNVADGPSRGQIAAGAYQTPCAYSKRSVQTQANGEIGNFAEGDESWESVEGARCDQGDSEEHQAEAKEPSGEGAADSSQSSSQALEGDGESKSSILGGGSVGQAESTDHPREMLSVKGYRDTVCRLLPEVSEFLQGGRFAASSKRIHRRPLGRIYGSVVPRRKGHERGRKDPCKHRISSLHLEREDGEIPESTEGVEKRGSTREQNSSPHGLGVWHGDDYAASGPPHEGFEDDHGLRHLHEAWGRDRPDGEEPSPSDQRRGEAVSMVCHSGQTFRRASTRQSGHLRQQHPPGLQGSKMVGSPASSDGQVEEEPGLKTVRLQCRRVSEGVCDSSQHDGSAQPPSIPTPSRRCSRGSKCRDTKLPRSQSPRALANRCQRPQIHEGGQDSTAHEPVVTRRFGILSMVSQEHGESFQGRSSSTKLRSGGETQDVATSTCLPHSFGLEVFAGTARITKSLQQRGIQAFPVDICISPFHNVLDSKLEHRVFNLVRTGRVSFVWCGMPCTSFSRARKWDGRGPGPIRTDDYLWGLPDLSFADKNKVDTGNALLYFTIRLLRLCEKYRIPYVLENPLSSMAWLMPPIQRFLRTYSPHIIHLDYCQFGEPWRKPTQLLFNYLDLSSVALQCQPFHGNCSRSKRPHLRLAGRDEKGVFWTLRAQPYPTELTDKIAALVAQVLKG